MLRVTKALLYGLILIYVLLTGGCGSDSDEADNHGVVIVFAAASTTDAVAEIAGLFKKETAVDVTINFASSSALAQQIGFGADADIFISANQKWADELKEKQLIAKRENIVGNSIVIIIPVDSGISVESAEILLSADVKSVAMGEPSSVPVGRYGKEALEKLGLWEKIEDKVVAAKDVRSALAYVETNAAEAGIVYSTDAAISDKVKVAYIFSDDVLSKPISYPAMTMKNAVNQKNADLFFDFLKSSKAKNIFKKYGFRVD